MDRRFFKCLLKTEDLLKIFYPHKIKFFLYSKHLSVNFFGLQLLFFWKFGLMIVSIDRTVNRRPRTVDRRPRSVDRRPRQKIS